MTTTTTPSTFRGRARLRTADCDLDELARITAQRTTLADFPLATEVVDDVIVYDADRLREAVARTDGEEAVAGELVRALTDGPGVVGGPWCVPGRRRG